MTISWEKLSSVNVLIKACNIKSNAVVSLIIKNVELQKETKGYSLISVVSSSTWMKGWITESLSDLKNYPFLSALKSEFLFSKKAYKC